jgi:hypothetical protein
VAVSPGAVISTVFFVVRLRYLVPSRPSSVRLASTGPGFGFRREEGVVVVVGWLRLPDKEACRPVDMGEAGQLWRMASLFTRLLQTRFIRKGSLRRARGLGGSLGWSYRLASAATCRGGRGLAIE